MNLDKILKITKALTRAKPTYTVEIEFDGGSSFLWKGTVDLDGTVIETVFELKG